MYLQLHDGPAMASRNYPNTPDLLLPQAIKISNRQILMQAIEEGGELALKKLDKASQKGNTAEELPTLSLDNLEELEELLDEDDGTMGKWWVETAKFLVKYGKIIYQGVMQFAKTVKLYRVNNLIQDYYDTNQYSLQQLNELSPRQIDAQLANISGDLLNATAQKDDLEAATLSRISQVYQQRKAMLPLLSRQTMLIGGGLLLAYLLMKKR